MIVKRFLLHSFSNHVDVIEYPIMLPEGSDFLDIKILHDGIYIFYSVPELEVPETQKEIFYLLKPDTSIPDKSKFVCILDAIVDVPDKGQAIIVFPVFKAI